MARRNTVMEAIASELADIIDTNLSVSDPNEYVGPLNDHKEALYPYYGIEIIGYNVEDDGLGGRESLATETYDTNDILQSREYQTRITLIIDIAIIVDDYNVQLRDDLYVKADERFSAYEGTRKQPSDLQADVTNVSSRGFEDAFTDITGVKGDRLGIDVTYTRTVEQTDVPAAETVDLEFTADGVSTPHPDKTIE